MANDFLHNCKCGFGTDDGATFRTHLLKGGIVDGKGVHASLNPLPRGGKHREEQSQPKVTEEDLLTMMPSAGQLAATMEEETAILSAVASRTAVASPPPKAAKQAPPVAKTEKPPKAQGSRQVWKICGGLALIGAGLILIYVLYTLMPKSPVFAIGLPSVVFGLWLVYKGFKTESSGPEVVVSKSTLVDKATGKPVLVKPNSLNLYPDRLGFEYTEGAPGLQWRFRRESKPYYLNMRHKEQESLIKLTLPDTKYIEPKLASVPLYMPANRRLYRRRKESLLKQLTPWAIVTAMLIVGFLMMTIGAPPNGG